MPGFGTSSRSSEKVAGNAVGRHFRSSKEREFLNSALEARQKGIQKRRKASPKNSEVKKKMGEKKQKTHFSGFFFEKKISVRGSKFLGS